MAPEPRTVFPKLTNRSPVWPAAIMLGALVTFYGLLAVYMARDHAWTDSVLQQVPLPATRATLAADAELASHLRIVSSRAWYTKLGDQTRTLVAEATVVNDALIPLSKVIIEASAQAQGAAVLTRSVVCGGAVSRRLLGRLPVEELDTLQELIPSLDALEPGRTIDCQVAFPDIGTGAEEVVLRIAWVEPLPGHPRPLFRPEG
jgi:hypothetical protein